MLAKVSKMSNDDCWECGKKLIRKQVDYILFGISLRKFPAMVCDSCGETFFDEKTSDEINQVAKKKGLFGLAAKTKIGQAGSTLDIRLSQKLIKFMGLKKGKEIHIHPENKNKLIIEL